MSFRVSLKGGPSATVDAERFVVEEGVYVFSTAAGLVASFPVSNVLSVVKETT